MLDLFSVSVVLIRGLAILIIVQALAIFPSAFVLITREPYPDGSSPSRDYSVAISLVSYVVLAVLLLVFAKKIGALLTRGLDNTSIHIDEGNLRVLQRVMFSVLGAYLLVYAFPALINMVAIAILPPTKDEDGGLFRSLSRTRISVEDPSRFARRSRSAFGCFLAAAK